MAGLEGQQAIEKAPSIKCPYCSEVFAADLQTHCHIEDRDGVWEIYSAVCPSCKRLAVLLTTRKREKEVPYVEIHAWPKEVNRPPLPPEVVEPYASDYYEACLILSDSPRASAALSRRCLQMLLREKADINPEELSGEIEQVLASRALPPEITSMVAGICDVGNFAAYPLKSSHPGLVQDVQPGEAEYFIDVLEALFDFYLVRPAQSKKKRNALKERSAASDANAQARARSVRRIVTYISAVSRD